MTSKVHFDLYARQCDPLPEEFDAAQCAVDQLLQRAAQQAAAPVELAQRVFERSAALLPGVPGHAAGPAPNRLRLVGLEYRRRAWHQLAWSRMAMAASLTLLVGLAVWFLQREAHRDHALEPSSRSVAIQYIDWTPAGSAWESERKIAYLRDFDSVDSMDDVTSDLALLVGALEM